MTDSAPALRRMLNEARERIRELEDRETEVREIERVVYVDKPRDVLQTVYVDRVVEVPGPATEVEKLVPFEVERLVYRDVLGPDVPGPERVVYRDVVVETPGPERVVEKPVPFEVPVVEYRDVIKEVYFPIEVEVEKPVPFEVRVVEYRDVIKEVEVPIEVLVDNPVIVEVPVPQYPPSVERVEVVREVYVDNPSHIETIRALQEKLCQFTSQSDSSQNPDQSVPSPESADSSAESAE